MNEKLTPNGVADTDIDNMSFTEKQLRLNSSQVAIDEIYARHGLDFAVGSDISIADYYAKERLGSLDWYKKANEYYHSGNEYSASEMFSNIEEHNIEKLAAWQHMYWNE